MTGPPRKQETGPALHDGNRPSDNDNNTNQHGQFTGSRPMEWHADLGLTDNDRTEDLRSREVCHGRSRDGRI
jgi:hypothetical protein